MMINLNPLSRTAQWIKAALFCIGVVAGFAACTNTPGQKTGVFNVRDFGATGDGTTLETAAFQKALDATSEAGGKLLVPKGKYLIGTIYLKDNTVFELLPGATLLGSANLADYDSLYWGHNEDRTPYHLIVAQNAKNVTIQGRGTIDGQGKNWYDHTDVKPRWMKKQVRRPSPLRKCTGVGHYANQCCRLDLACLQLRPHSRGWYPADKQPLWPQQRWD